MSNTNSQPLYEVIREYHQQLSSLNDTDLPPEVVFDTIEAMQGDVEMKIRAVVAYALQIKADAETRKAHAKRMAESAKAMESRYDSLMMYAQIGVMNSGIKLPINLPEFTLNLAKNPPSVDVTASPVDVPAPFLRRTIRIEVPMEWAEADVRAVIANAESSGAIGCCDLDVDKKALLDALKVDPEPHKAYARLNPTSYRLTVR